MICCSTEYIILGRIMCSCKLSAGTCIFLSQINNLSLYWGCKLLSHSACLTEVVIMMVFVFQPANVLQAILCLINELDRDALEIVDDAIRNRLDMSL